MVTGILLKLVILFIYIVPETRQIRAFIVRIFGSRRLHRVDARTLPGMMYRFQLVLGGFFNHLFELLYFRHNMAYLN